MLYRFSVTDARRVQAANYLCLRSPRIHETRKLDFHDFIYMIDGEWDLALGREIYHMKPNDLLVLPAGMTHRGISLCSPNTQIFYLHIYPEDGDGANDTANDPNDGVSFNNFISTENYPHVKLLIEHLVQLKNAPTVSTAYVNTLLYELGSITQNNDGRSLAGQIKNYLLSSESFPTNKEIAERFFVSQKTVEKVFKQAYGVTVHQYLLKHKLESAKQYLRDYPNITLYEISNMLGFCDEHHLSRMFKREFGLSPREYKKLKRLKNV